MSKEIIKNAKEAQAAAKKAVISKELIEKAKEASSAEEFLALARETGAELTGEQAKAYFDRLHSAAGELSDDELDAVAGGDWGDWGDSVFHPVSYRDGKLEQAICPHCKKEEYFELIGISNAQDLYISDYWLLKCLACRNIVVLPRKEIYPYI